MDRREMQEKYKLTLAEIEKANPKEDGSTYDMGVCLDMLISDYKSMEEGKEPAYKFDGMDKFEWQEFGKDYKAMTA